MKKIFVLIVFVFCLTGCNGVAKINIEKDEITENITVYSSNDSEYAKVKNWNGLPLPLYYDQELENPFSNNKEKEKGVRYYNVNFDDTSKIAKATASFDINNHTRSSFIRGCFKYYNISENDGTIIFSTSLGLICSFTNFDVIISTPYKVVNNNAEKVDKVNNTYTWNINESNSKDISIYLEVDFSKKYNETDSDIISDDSSDAIFDGKETSNNVVFIVIAIIIILSLITIFVLKNKKNKISKI